MDPRDLEWDSLVSVVFGEQPDLCSRILAAAPSDSGPLPGLFRDISLYVLQLRGQQLKQELSQDLAPNPKKRKVDGGASIPSTQPNGATSNRIKSPSITFECKDVSVQIPARKKQKVQFISDANDNRTREIQLLNSTTNVVDYVLPADQIEEAFCLPVPDKQARQSYIAIFPQPGATQPDGTPAEQIVFTLNDTAPPSAARSTEVALTADDTYVTATQLALERLLSTHNKSINTPSAAEFASTRPQAHRKGEKAYHVSCYRGSKEGYLFFLPNGILFGFKKPLAFYPFAAIESISYTSVLQRTFNLVISARPTPDSQDVTDHEFSMLDQEDFAGIDEYVKRHGLNDASMAAERRAKAYNVNKAKEMEINGDVGAGVEEGGELQKAEQQLQDAEDEEEEDYEASGGSSDGSGAESEEDEEDGEEYGDEEGEEEVEGEEYEDEE